MTWDIRLHALILLAAVVWCVAMVVWAMCVSASERDDHAEAAVFDEQRRLAVFREGCGEIGRVEWDDPRGPSDGLGRAA